MNASFTPHEVDSGWWFRWPRDAGALIFRQPLGFAFMVLLVAALAFVPQNAVSSAPVSIIIGALVMSWSRSADHHAGAHVWAMLKSSMRDAAQLAWNVFIYVLSFTVIMAVLHYVGQGLFSVTGAHHAVVDPLWTRVSPWLRSAFHSVRKDQMVSISPWFLFMVYIALSMGHPGFWLLSNQSVMGMIKNIPPAGTFLLFGMIPTLLTPLVHHLGTGAGVLMSVFCVSLLNVTLILMGYLFAREVYDGQKRNVPAPARRALALNPAEGQLARVRVLAR